MSFLDDAFGGGQGSASEDLSKGLSKSIEDYNKYLDKVTAMYQPYMDQGKTAGNNMMDMGNSYQNQFNSMMGNGAGGTGNWQTQYQESPWAKYQTGLGTQSALAGAAAGGMLGSGVNMRDLDTMSQGISSADRQNYFNDAMQLGNSATNNYSPLQSTGANMANNLGSFNMNTGKMIGDADQQIGQANAAGDVANSNMWNNMFNTADIKSMGKMFATAGMGGDAGTLASGGTISSPVFNATNDADAMRQVDAWNKSRGWS